jgi:protein-tyrosine phosphatase
VVDVRSEEDDTDLAQVNRLTYRQLPTPEGLAPDLSAMIEMTAWIGERIGNGEKVLVFCHEGRGRSAMLACAVLVSFGLPLAQAYAILQRARPEASLSLSQLHRLDDFEASRTIRPNG